MFIQFNRQCKQFLWRVFVPFSYYLIYFILSKPQSTCCVNVGVHVLENLGDWLVYLTRSGISKGCFDKFLKEWVPGLMVCIFWLKMANGVKIVRQFFLEVNGLVE